MLKQKLHIAYLNSLIFAQSCSTENRCAYKMYFACSEAGQKIDMCRIYLLGGMQKIECAKLIKRFFQ